MILLPLLVSLCVSAAPPECAESDPTMCAVPLEKGQPAPFDGQLLTSSLAIKLGQRADRCAAILQEERDYLTKIDAANVDYQRQLRSIETDSLKQQLDLTRKMLLQKPDETWYTNPVFVSAVSVVVTAAMFSVSVWAAGHLN